MKTFGFIFLLTQTVLSADNRIPIVVTTWRFLNASSNAWQVLNEGGTALDAVERGASTCEEEQCDGTVGYGGSPDENGETTLDALIMDGRTMNVGAVAALRRVKSAISVARRVLENTKHSMLAGELATQFALQMGFKEEPLYTKKSKQMWMKWHNEDSCQPNFWINVNPDPTKQCGPYHVPKKHNIHEDYQTTMVNRYHHDTIGMIAIDANGDIAAGTSTNGAKFKIPGRVGDSPIPGAGAYADNDVGAAASTGDGDVMLRFLPSFLAVEEMRRGASPREAAKAAVKRISSFYPEFMGAVIAISKNGIHGAACHGIPIFPYVVKENDDKNPVKIIKC